jgi:hypothetical protein
VLSAYAISLAARGEVRGLDTLVSESTPPHATPCLSLFVSVLWLSFASVLSYRIKGYVL